MKVDFHMHAFKDALAPKVIPNLAKVSGYTPHTDGTISGVEGEIAAAGLDYGVVLNIATSLHAEPAVNDWAASIDRGRIVAFASIHPDNPDPQETLRQLGARGFRGIKLHPDYQEFMIDEPRMFPIYEAIAELGLPVVFHAGFDPLSPDLVHAPPEACLAVHRAFPKMKMVLAHMGGFRAWDVTEDLFARTGIYLDTAICADTMPREQAERFVKKYGAEHILMGSDLPWQSTRMQIEWIDTWRISSHEKDLILGGNAQYLLQLEER